MAILARLRGWCHVCSAPILPGHRIVSVDSGWQHVACAELPADTRNLPEPAEPVWTMHEYSAQRERMRRVA